MKCFFTFFIVVFLSITIFAQNSVDSDGQIKRRQSEKITDVDGNTYGIIEIGNQTWMTENLKVSQYPDGTPIPQMSDSIEWLKLENNKVEAAYCFYNNDESLNYGALYTYVAAKNACPSGWHLPSDDEWSTLELYLATNGYNFDGTSDESEFRKKIGKALASSTDWHLSVETGQIGNAQESNNSSGFNALPVGHRAFVINSEGIASKCFFSSSEETTFFWTSTPHYKNDYQSFARQLSYYNSFIGRSYLSKSRGLSVRCIKNIESSLISNEKKFQANVYPNPVVGGVLYIDSDNIIEKIEIIDLSGKVVLHQTTNNKSCILDISNLEKGIYFMKVANDILKIMKE